MSRQVPVVGVVGSIGSGKTAVAAGIADRLDGLHLNADVISHNLLHNDEIKRQLRVMFGPSVFGIEGAVSRQKLADLVFGKSPTHASNRARLEQLMHPAIRDEIESIVRHADRTRLARIVVLDAAVLLEAGWRDDCDLLLCVDAPRPIRVQRVASRGWDSAELLRREGNQLPLQEKVGRADLLLDNSGELNSTVDRAVEFIMNRYPQLRPKVAEIP